MSLSSSLRNGYDHAPRFVRRSLGGVVGAFPARVRYGPVFARAADLARRMDAVGVAAGGHYQLAQLQRLWQAAVRETDYFARLVKEGHAPREIRSFADFRQVPLLTKQTVREQGEGMFNHSFGPRDYRIATTGGTTGEPLLFRVTHDASAREWALMLEAWRRVGYSDRNRRAVLRGLLVQGSDQGRRWDVDPVNHAVVLSAFDMEPRDMRAYLEILGRRPIGYLHAYPSTALELSGFVLKEKPEPPHLDAIILGSETVHDEQVETMKEAFGCRVYTWYGHTEKCVFAAACEYDTAYHVCVPYGYAEIVDADGNVIDEPGRRGTIVGTGFVNEATALIRYVTDDEAEWRDEPCACGRPGRRIDRVLAHRGQETLIGRSGSMVSITTLHGIHDPIFERIRQYQFRQSRVGEVDFVYVPWAPLTETELARLRRVLDSRLSAQLVVTYREVDHIDRTKAGKWRFVEQRIPGVDGSATEAPAPRAGEAPTGDNASERDVGAS